MPPALFFKMEKFSLPDLHPKFYLVMLIYLPPQAMVFCTLGLLNSDLVIQQILVEYLLCVRLVGHGAGR